MHRPTPQRLAALALLLLAACETREVLELRATLAEREQELVRKKYMADEFAMARRDLAHLRRKLEPFAAPAGAREPVELRGLSPAKLLETLRAWPPAAGSAVQSFEVGEDASSKATLLAIHLPAPAAPATPARPPPSPRKPLPEASILSGSQGKRLRAQIARAEKESADLDRIVVELDAISGEFQRVRAQLEALEALAWGRVGAEPGFFDKLFAGPRPLLESGKVEAIAGGLTVSGQLAPGVKAEELRAAVPAGFGVHRLVEEAGTVALEAVAR